jgi:two-component system chemotaxis response regulator CheB
VPKHDIIVAGASAGGVKALQEFCRGLPANLEASVFVVLHLPPWLESNLPDILSASGRLRAIHPEQDQAIEPGRIYVAPPNRHLILENGRVYLWNGPKENRNLPAINPLFRTAAVHYGPRVVGIILTGCLDDGSTGLWWIKRFGGVAIVQDPLQAEQPEMPRSALKYVDVDYVAGISEMAPLVMGLVNGEVGNVAVTRAATKHFSDEAPRQAG